MLDAYTVRKAVPRILLAAIGINISIYLCVAMIDIVNILGSGLADLIVTPFRDSASFGNATIDSNLGGVALVTGFLATGGIIWVIGAQATVGFGLLAMLIPLVISMALISLAIIFTLVIRQALIIFLTIVSPVAIACFVLPGTEKYFKKWFDLYIKTLMVYPIVAAIFAVSSAMVSILVGTSGSSPDAIGFTKAIAAVIVAFLPLVLIPFAFKLAGGAIGAVMSAGAQRAGGLSGRAGQSFNKWRSDPNSAWGRKMLANQSKRVEDGKTARQVWAARPSSNSDARRRRMRAAQKFDRDVIMQKSADTNMVKSVAQDSDVLESILMTDAEIAQSRSDLATDLAAGRISQQQYDRRMDAHAEADLVGRTAANQRFAFFSGDRIKFVSPVGTAGYERERDLARRVFGEEGAANAMNSHQAIAAGIGRSDLASALYAEDPNPVRGSSKAGAAQILSGHSNGVKGALEDHIATINSTDPTITIAQRAQAAQTLAGLVSNAESQYGAGTEENKRLVRQRKREIMSSLEAFATSPRNQSSYLHEDLVIPGQGEVTTVDPATGNQVTTPAPQTVLSGGAAASVRLRRMATMEFDPALQAQQSGAGQQNQGGAKQGGGGNATSDARLKTNYFVVGTLPDGIKLYEFEYIWSPKRYVGVMAQEVLSVKPDAVTRDVNGFYQVNYDYLGIRMVEVASSKRNLKLT